MRKSYLEIDGVNNETLWIVNEKERIAYETRDYKERPGRMGIFISHDISSRHFTSILELKELGEHKIPKRFYSLIK